MINELRAALRRGWAITLLVALCAGGALAQAPVRTFVTGDMIVCVAHGTAQTTVADLAKSVNAAVVKPLGVVDAMSTQDAYLLRLTEASPTDPDTLAAIAQLKGNASVRYAGPNKLYYRDDSTPNDPRFSAQWGLPLMNMPQAWDIEKGETTVTVAVIDTGADTSHPDLASRLQLPGVNTSGTGAADDVTDNDGHGTHVSGIIGAATDNGVGVSGVTWQNVKVFPIKASDDGSFTQAALLAALDAADKAGVQVVNMSLGSADTSDDPDLTDPFNQKILSLAKKGIIFTLSAGNAYASGNPPHNPSNLASVDSHILCVAAVGPNKEHAWYSTSRKTTTIAAPGGDDPTGANASAEILSTLPVNQGSYGFEQGTSMAAPAAAGVVALLLSVPGVSPDDIKTALTTTADPAGQPVPNNDMGYGVINAFQALLHVAVSVIVVDTGAPGGVNAPIETLHPNIRVQVRQVTPSNLTVSLDNNPLVLNTDYTITNVISSTTDQNGTSIPTRYDIVISKDLTPGIHRLSVVGVNPGPPSRTASVTQVINISPHLVAQGRSLVSIPYFQTVPSPITPEYYLGTDFRLGRWLPDQGRYVFYTSFGPQDPGASFNPPGTTVHQDGLSNSTNPLGLAFWTDTDSVKPVLTKGQALTNLPIIIPLKGNGTGDSRYISWNMVGDPFPFDVPFNAMLVDTPEGRLAIGDAVAKGYLIPNIYSYDGDNGYTFRTLPDGAVRAWSGHWIGVTSKNDISLVVPPAKLVRSVPLRTRAATPGGGWSLRIGATAKGLHDTYNFIGTASGASPAYDLTKAPKPPMMSPYVSLAISHDDWGAKSGLYAQDLRPTSGIQTWHIVAGTDQANSTVTINWDGSYQIPRNVKLTLKDETTGESVDMRTRASVSFNTGTSAESRKFTVTARPSTASFVRISNLIVRPSGSRAAATSTIGFTLTGDASCEVKILNAAGQPLGTIATRAASAGDVRILWNGKDAAGRAVPAGTYIVQIRATGPDGDSVRAIQPFAVLR